MPTDFKLSCVLFDLDGTLLDTAPDSVLCLNKALSQHGFTTVKAATIKHHISFGALAMINGSLDHSISEADRADILITMLDLYENNIAEHTVFFKGMADTLDAIEAQGLKWGVVTNKRERFTNPLMAALKLTDRAACIISGDTTGNPNLCPVTTRYVCR